MGIIKLPVRSSLLAHLACALVGLVTLLAGGGTPVAAATTAAILAYAAPSTDGVVELRARPGEDRKVVTTLAPGTMVEVLEGPTAEGWYRVAPVRFPEARPGWLRADHLVFNHFVRATSDLNLLAAPSEQSTVVTWVRRGIVLTVVGPGTGEYLLVRYGDTVGYAPAPALRASDGPATDPFAERWVDVNRSTGEVRLMIGETVVDTFQAAVSADQGEGFYATATGTYAIYEKIAGLTYTPYANAYFMYWAGFDPTRFNGFHSWTMDAYGNVLDGGWRPTAGCVATAPADAKVIYDFVTIGTRVEIHW